MSQQNSWPHHKYQPHPNPAMGADCLKCGGVKTDGLHKPPFPKNGWDPKAVEKPRVYT